MVIPLLFGFIGKLKLNHSLLTLINKTMQSKNITEIILSQGGSQQAANIIKSLSSGKKVDLGAVRCLCQKDREFLLQQMLKDSLSVNSTMFGFAPDAINNNPNLVAMLLNSMSLNLSTLLPRLARGYYYSGLGATFSSNDEVAVSPMRIMSLLADISVQDWNVNSDSITFDDNGNITIGADVFTSYELPGYNLKDDGYLGHFISVDTFNTNRGLTTLSITNVDSYNCTFKKEGAFETAFIFIPNRKTGLNVSTEILKDGTSVVPILKASIEKTETNSTNKFYLFDSAADMKETTIKAVNASLTVQPVAITPAVIAHLTVAILSGDFGNFFEHLKSSFGAGR